MKNQIFQKNERTAFDYTIYITTLQVKKKQIGLFVFLENLQLDNLLSKLIDL